MEQAAHLISAIATLLWPIITAVALFGFRSEIAAFFGRLTKGKFFGQEFELKQELEELANTTSAAEIEADALPKEDRRLLTTDQEDGLESTIRLILQQAASSPKIALMTLAAEMEKQARQALATRGLLQGKSFIPVTKAFSELNRFGFPPNLSGSLSLFLQVRNKIVHGFAATNNDILMAIDEGINILRVLNALPNEVNIVSHPGVPVFHDAACMQIIADAKGVILETTSPGGAVKTLRIFPSTLTHFQKGKRVAWEWNMNRVWTEAWYRDPDTNEIKLAWNSSAEFVGRNLDEV